MTGHQDKSEENSSSPLISISLGLDAIFLIAEPPIENVSLRDDHRPPLALRLQSGDVVVMSGPSRLAYHGVPKVVSDDNSFLLFGDLPDGVGEYMRDVRININVRQVTC